MSSISDFKSFLQNFLIYFLSILMAFQPKSWAGDGDSEADREIVVSGQKGADGSHESDYTNRAADGSGNGGDGSNGRAGRDATAPETGQNGGQIRVQLSRGQRKNSISLRGVMQTVDQSNPTQIDRELTVPEIGDAAKLRARGGGGGRGGIGGGGQNGGSGASGADATRWSTGDNGGDGGNGGRQGSGTNGGDTGKGGLIAMDMESRDTDLLMLVETDVGVDDPGEKGRHGNPGKGGSGGRGGSSYTWTETETETESYTDSDGKSQTRTVSVTKSYTNAGGSDGSSGSQGDMLETILRDGKRMQLGEVNITVRDSKGGIKHYTSRYNLVLENYDIVSANEDGVIEPGELVYLKNIRVRNNGGMPLPENAKMIVYVGDSKLFKVKHRRLTLPVGLNAGEEYVFKTENLSFQINNDILTQPKEESGKERDVVQPRSRLESQDGLVDRDFKGFSGGREIQIEYPLKIEPIATSRSMAPGESSRMIIKITNISSKDIDLDQVRRQIQLAIQRDGGEMATHEFTIRDASGKPINLAAGFLQNIHRIKAGESYILEGQVSIDAGAKPFQNSDISFELSLSDIETLKLETIQDRKISFKVSQVYRQDKKADVLLVVNNGVTRQLVLSWQNMLATVGLKSNIWDLSYYAHLNLTKALENDSSLAADFKGKTVVILNNNYDNNLGLQQATNDLSRSQLPELLAHAGAGLLVFGQQQGTLSGSGLQMLAVGTDEIPQREIVQWKFWKGKPVKETLQAASQAQAAQLQSQNSTVNHVVSWTFNPTVLKKGWFGSDWSLGTMTVQRSLSLHDGPLVSLAAKSETVLDPTSAQSRSLQFAFFMAMPIQEKMRAFNQLIKTMQTGGEGAVIVPRDRVLETTLKALSDAIVATIAVEQDAARRTNWQASASRAEIKQRLQFLEMLSTMVESLKNRGRTDIVPRIIMDMMISIEGMVHEKGRWWQLLFPKNSHRLINSESQRMFDVALNKLFPVNRLFGGSVFESYEVEMLKSASRRRQGDIKRMTENDVNWVNPKVQSSVADTASADYRSAISDLEQETRVQAMRAANLAKDRAAMRSTALQCVELFN